MNSLRVAAIVVALGLAVMPALGRQHFNMGPVGRFAPESGSETDFISFANGFTIDTRAGEPALPAALRLDGVSGGDQYYIIQFKGPTNNRWS